jgi:hypothetical protein
MNTYKLSIPTPCQESWDGMTPNAQGKFCGQCQKTVTNFTGMTTAQINTYMLLHNGKKVCGRFDKTQLESIVIQIPAKVMYSQTSFRKVFMLALLVVMGTALLSCTDDFGNKQYIEQVLVTDTAMVGIIDSINIPPPPADSERFIMGAIAISESDKLLPPPSPPVKVYAAPKNIADGVKNNPQSINNHKSN